MSENLEMIIALSDVKDYDNVASFPAVGKKGRIYIDKSFDTIYLWNGSSYTLVSGAASIKFLGDFDALTLTPDPEVVLTDAGDALIVYNADPEGTVITLDTVDYTVFVGSFIVKTTTGFTIINEEYAVFRNVDEGRIPKIENGLAVNSALIETVDEIISDKTIRTPPGSVEVGSSVTLSEIGGFITSNSNVSGNTFVQLDYQIEDSGTSNPIYYSRAARQNNVVVQSDDTQTLTNVTSYSISPTTDDDVIAIYLDFVGVLTNFRLRVTSDATGKPVKYFPNEAAWRSGTGNSISTGKQRLEFETPLAELSTVTFTVDIIADQQIDLRGDGTNPYRAIDRRQITNIIMSHENNVVSQIEAKTGTDKLSFNALKEVPTDITDLSTHSVTELNDITNAGSGAIITNAERTKLNNIEDGAEVNVQSDWNQTAITEDNYIKNKPDDITDLSVHSVTELNDVTSAGSGAIITTAERNKLAGIEDGAEVNNISDSNATDLTSMGDIDLHFHSSDRDRANHTGTQLASTISDFDTEVANNSAVIANTAKVTNATHIGEVTGSGALTVQSVAISNKALTTATSGQEVLVNDAGTLKKVNASDFLGDDNNGVKVYYAETLAESNTGSFWTNKVTLNLPSDFEAGDYFIEVNYGWRGSSTLYKFQSRVQLDYSNLGTYNHIQEPKDSNNRHVSFRRFKRTMTGGSHKIELDYGESGGGTAYIWDASITVTKVDIQ